MSLCLSEKIKEAKVFFVMGGPGSGKATQCHLMSTKYGLTHLSSGGLLRAQVALGTEGGRRLNRIMSHGELVPLIDVMHLLKDAMYARILDSPGFLIEGFPRDKEQAEKFEVELSPCQGVIYIEVPESVMRQRLLRRGREVDNVETILKKLKLFAERTYPVISNYQKRGLVIKVNGQGTVEEVFQRVQSGLMKFRGRSSSSSSHSTIHGLDVKTSNKPNSQRKTDVVASKKSNEESTHSQTDSTSDSVLEVMATVKTPAVFGGHIGKSADKEHHHQSHHQAAVNQETGHHGKSHHGKSRSQSPRDHSSKDHSPKPSAEAAGKSEKPPPQ